MQKENLCIICGVNEKPLKPNGYKDSWCKQCRSKKHKENMNNPNFVFKKREYQKEYSRRPEVKEYRKKYYSDPKIREKYKLQRSTPEAIAKQKLYSKSRLLKIKYNLTIEQYEKMVKEQNGKCFICGEISKLNIDHDHRCCPGENTCGKCIRGLLCSLCNSAIGQLKDNTEILKKAIYYLETKTIIKI